jgi:hypothetical protein
LSTDVSEVRATSIVIALMMEAARTSEMSVDNYFTRQYIPEDKYALKMYASRTIYIGGQHDDNSSRRQMLIEVSGFIPYHETKPHSTVSNSVTV